MKSLLITTLAATLFVSCTSPLAPTPPVKKQILKKPTPIPTPPKRKFKKKPKVVLPPAPESTHVDKVIEDDNHQESYMYPEDGKAAKKDPVTTVPNKVETPNSEKMSKASCITMIGQEKFDKYSKMFGNEEASIKRCAMMKAMKKD